MARYRGAGQSPGMAMGQAALATRRGGPPPPPEGLEPREEVSEFSAIPERPDVVLVIEDPRDMADAWPGWANVVAVVAEREAALDAVAPVPCVIGVTGVLRAAHDGDLMLVDADQGFVTIDPDMRAVSEFQQAQAERRSGARYVLGQAHLPAATSDGAPVRVAAWVASASDAEVAMRSGADAFVVLWGAGSRGDVATRLRRLARLSAGKPLTLLRTDGVVSAAAMAREAVHLDLTIALGAAGGASVFTGWRAEVAAARTALHAQGALAAEPRLAAWMRPGDDPYLPGCDISRVIVLCSIERWPPSPDMAAWLDRVGTGAVSAMAPLELGLDRAEPADIRMAIGAGAAAVIVPPACVSDTKGEVRRASRDECRAAFLRCAADRDEPDRSS